MKSVEEKRKWNRCGMKKRSETQKLYYFLMKNRRNK